VKTISSKGKYWVKIADSKGNISLASDTLYFGVNPPTSIENPTMELALTYTNPSSDAITINYFSPEANSRLIISLWDMRGVKTSETVLTQLQDITDSKRQQNCQEAYTSCTSNGKCVLFPKKVILK
jgi:hypothetical protein